MEARVGLLVVDLLVPGSVTLKDKRQVVRSLLDRAAARFNVSAAEIDHLETRGRALLAFACVSNDATRVRQELGRVQEMAEAEPRAEIVRVSLELL
jgi:hypothetical protein